MEGEEERMAYFWEFCLRLIPKKGGSGEGNKELNLGETPQHLTLCILQNNVQTEYASAKIVKIFKSMQNQIK